MHFSVAIWLPLQSTLSFSRAVVLASDGARRFLRIPFSCFEAFSVLSDALTP